MKKVLITGANSYIGTSFKKYVSDNKDITVDTLDMLNDNWMNFDFFNYDVILHVAAIVHIKEKNSMKDIYYKVNRDLPIQVAKKAKEQRVKQFIFMSTMAVYGLEEGIITKNTFPNPKSFYGKSKYEAELELNKLESKDFNLCIVRPPMVYGDGCKGNYQRLIKLAKRLPIYPTYKNKRSMVSIDNLCLYLKRIIEEKQSGIILPQDDEYVCTVEMMKLLRDKKVLSTSIFNVGIKLLVKYNKVFKKLFGTLIYKKEE